HHGALALSTLDRSARSSRAEARVAAAPVLGHLEEAGAELRLLRMVGDSEDAVQMAAAVALTSPPRAILEENLPEFARALDATRTRRNRKAAYRLSLLAAHAKIDHEKVLKALVDLAAFHEQAIASLAHLTGAPLENAEACRKWWKERG
ncbi:MAG: hypothetical protein HC813_00050, partial [Planctomycetes bacterium]|nr:hypothetical protein [Planctomycetota bacterium]